MVKDNTLLLLGAGALLYFLSKNKVSDTQADTAAQTYIGSDLGTTQNTKATNTLIDYANQQKAAGKNNAQIVNELTNYTPSSSKKDAAGIALPPVKNTPQISYGAYTKAPATATVTPNASGGYNIKL